MSVAILLLAISPLVYAGSYEDGEAAYRKGDFGTAAQEFRKAAEQGELSAQFMLGRMYRWGKGVPQDYAEAVKWYRKAAEKGDVRAQNNLGLMYMTGQGVELNYIEAHKWYQLAAEQGDTYARHNLGNIYRQSIGVPKDFMAAYMWYHLAANQGDKEALKSRESIAEKMTPAQITEARELARKWLKERQLEE